VRVALAAPGRAGHLLGDILPGRAFSFRHQFTHPVGKRLHGRVPDLRGEAEHPLTAWFESG